MEKQRAWPMETHLVVSLDSYSACYLELNLDKRLGLNLDRRLGLKLDRRLEWNLDRCLELSLKRLEMWLE